MTGSHLETKQEYKNMWSQDQHRFPPSPTNRTSAGYVKKHSMANLTISKWGSNLLGVWCHLNHKDTLASVQTVATCSISRGCTFAWRRQSCPSRRDGNWRRHATPYGYWPLLRSTNIDDGVTHSVLVPHVRKTRTLQNFSCWCSSTSRCMVISTDTDDYRSTRFPRILIDNRWFCLTLLDQKSHTKCCSDLPKFRGTLNIRTCWSPSKIHMSVDSNLNDQ